MLTNTRTILVEWGDCDPAGIVHNPRYFFWFDACTAAIFTAAGWPKPQLLKKFEIVGIPVVDMRAQFFASSKFGDEVTVVSTITEFRNSSFDVRHQLRQGDVLAVECCETRVWVGQDPENPGRLKSRKIPDEVIARFSEVPQ
jgi:4-hydroxybenzoyl-CoA thioesterase